MRIFVNANCVSQFAKLGMMDSYDTVAQRIKYAREQFSEFKTQKAAADRLGLQPSTYSDYETGHRVPRRPRVIRIAKAFKVRWEWLLENDGPPKVGKQGKFVGEIADGSEVSLYPIEKVEEGADLPPGATPATVAIRVCGDSMRGIADKGWLIYFDDQRRPPTDDLLGKLCVIKLRDGKTVIKYLEKGHRKGHFDLESRGTDPILRDQRVAWAALVTWIKQT